MAVNIRRLSAGRIPPCSWKVSVFVLLKPSVDLLKPKALCREICFTGMPAMQMLVLSENTSTETTRIMLDHITGHSGPAK